MIITTNMPNNLNKKSSKITRITDYHIKLAEEMSRLMHENNAVGIAAPQVGEAVRLVVLRLGSREVIIINPVIKNKKGSQLVPEGCLSVPDYYYEVERPVSLTVSGKNLKDENVEYKCSGIEAAIVKHECLPNNSKVFTVDGIKTIKEIVESKYSGKVLSLVNETIAYSPVIGWSKKRNITKKKWVSLNHSKTGPQKNLRCTEDHLCGVIQNVFSNEGVTFIEAKNSVGSFLVKYGLDENNLYNSDQISIIIGSVLGDGNISKGVLSINHGEPQKNYAEFKSKILNARITRGFSGYRNENSNYSIICNVTAQTKELEKVVYTKKKTIKRILPMINEIALAIWYMDDGNLNNKNSTLHTESFLYDDIELLCILLNEKFGIECWSKKRKENQYVISISRNGTKTLCETIHSYIPISMEYKLLPEFRDKEKYIFNNKRLEFACRKITHIKYLNTLESCLFNIKTESGNFISNNSLVHNCDHLNGILISDIGTKLNKKIKHPEDKLAYGGNSYGTLGTNAEN